ncbi:hypothetical protein [Dokdonella soli]|uniref:hypothetical protein n=1 Tax=Dokdonella soli TaxID=529810 RepID=UPI0031DEAD48
MKPSVRTSAVHSTKKVLLLELNEVNWRVVDRLTAQHGQAYLPNFQRLRTAGAWATQTAVEHPPHLDPWITWVTLHTGVPREVHGAAVLEQDAASISAPRLWDYAAEGGRSVGVFGSISAFPPRPVEGFIVPGPFAPSDDTYPDSLRPIQALNRLGTSLHNRTGKSVTAFGAVRNAFDLLRLGLRMRTLYAVARQLVLERVSSSHKWRRVSLQPLLNFDFFAHLYRKFQPDFATWHTNHAAHYMHHYWRAWDDNGFAVQATAAERAQFGDAVPYGYRVCDRLIGDFLRLIDDDTVLVVASSMGQQPFVTERYQSGKIVVRFLDIERILDITGRDGILDVVPTMVPQWNLRIPDRSRRTQLREQFQAAKRIVAGREEAAISVEETADLLTVTPLGLADKPAGIRYHFPLCERAQPAGYAIDELFATDTPTTKQGMHHPAGLLAFIGSGIRPGVQLADCTNLDVAPTVLTLLGLPVPAVMHGRILNEAWEATPNLPRAEAGLAATAA